MLGETSESHSEGDGECVAEEYEGHAPEISMNRVYVQSLSMLHKNNLKMQMPQSSAEVDDTWVSDRRNYLADFRALICRSVDYRILEGPLHSKDLNKK